MQLPDFQGTPAPFMRVPEYKGEPLAVMSRITREDAPEHLWHYTLKLTPQASNLDTVNRLTEQGYKPIEEGTDTERGHIIACLVSQLHDVVGVQNNSGITTIWAHHKSVEFVQKYPVLLCFTLQNDEHPDIEHVQMLQPLPLPRYGEYAVIGVKDATLYHARDLDESAQQLKTQLGQTILDLAGGSQWATHIPAHALCALESQYISLRTDFRTRSLAFRGKRGQEAKANLENLDKAHHDVVTLRQSWLRPDWLHQWKEIRRMAQELAANYHDHHKKKQEQKDPPPPAITPFFGEFGDLGLFCSANPVAGVFSAIHNAENGADKWNPGGKDAYPSYHFIHNKQKDEREKKKMENTKVRDSTKTSDEEKSGYTIIEFGRTQASEVVENNLTEELFKQVLELDDYAADVFLYTLAQLVKANGQDAWVWANDFLDHRGVVRKYHKQEERTAGHHSEDIHRVGYSLYQIQRLWIRFREVILKYPPPPKRKGAKQKPPTRKLMIHSGRVLTIQQEWTQTTLFANDELANDRQPVAWKIHPGDWLQEYLDAPRMVAFFFEKSLQYEPEREKWEKRLSRYFMFHLRINAKHQSSYITRGVGLLINELSLPINADDPIKTRKRFEKAMNRLKADKLIDDWSYSKESQTTLPRYRWLDTWLQWKVNVYVAARLKALPNPAIEEIE